MQALATVPAPRSRLLPESVAGHRVGWFPCARLLFAEGHPSPDGLCRSDDLPSALQRVSDGLENLGILPQPWRLQPLRKFLPNGSIGELVTLPVIGGTGFAGIRRLDSTVDLAFDRPAEGLAALAGVSALPLPRVKTETIRERGGRRVETVTFRGSSGRSILARWYDKGVESGLAPRGLRVRPEDQRRFAKGSRPDVEAVAASTFVRDAFVKRFEPLWRASKGVRVGGVTDLAVRLTELQETGDLSPSQAKALAGHLLLDSVGGQLQAERTCRRDRALARRHGLVLADGVLDEVEVDLGEVLERALDSEAWGARG